MSSIYPRRTIKVSDNLFVEADKFDFKPKLDLGHEGYMWKQGDSATVW
jgi:hypothetical protein